MDFFLITLELKKYGPTQKTYGSFFLMADSLPKKLVSSPLHNGFIIKECRYEKGLYFHTSLSLSDF